MAIVTAHVAAVQQLYVAYFNRPADTAGLDFWTNVVANQKGSTALVSAAFAAEAEYKTEYTGLTNADVVNKVYLNLFGRPAETAGKAYWADLLDRKVITIDKVVAAISSSALTTDATAYNNKVTGATAFTNALDTTAEQNGYRGAAANALAKAYVTSITTDASLTVATAPATLNATVSKVVVAGTPFTLQSGLTSLQSANDAKIAFLDAADGKVDKILMPETGTGSIAAKVTSAVTGVDALVAGYAAASSAGVKAALLADKVAANTNVLAAAQVEVAEDQVAISKVAGLSAAVAAQISAVASVTAAEGTVKTAAADLAAKLAAYNSLNGTSFVMNADGSGQITGLIKADSSGKLVVNASSITETANPGITALIAASTANEAAEKALISADKAEDVATANVNYLDVAAGSTEAANLAAVKAAMVNVTVSAAASPTLEQIATEQAILDAKAAAAPTDTALANAAASFKATVKAYTDVYAENKLVTELSTDQAKVTAASKAITDLTKATAALDTANALAAQLVAVNGAVAAAEQAFVSNEFSLPVTLAGTSLIASAGADIYVAGTTNTSVALFGLQGTDSLFIGTKYTLNTTATYNATTNVVTGGNDAVLEAFMFQDGADTVVILEKSVFGSSASTPEVVTITLTGVAVADVALSNGIVTG